MADAPAIKELVDVITAELEFSDEAHRLQFRESFQSSMEDYVRRLEAGYAVLLRELEKDLGETADLPDFGGPGMKV